MSPSRHVMLAGAAVVAAAIFVAYEYRHVGSLEASLADAKRRPLKIAPSQPASPAKAASASTPATPPPGELPARVKQLIEAAPRSPGGVPMVRPEALFADLPTVKAAFSRAAEGQQRLGYAQFIRTVQLSPTEEQQFIAILANREATWGDIRASATEQGLPLAGPEVTQMDEKNFAETEANLRALLGPQRYEQLQQYRETLDARLGMFSLNALVSTSYATNQPFTLEQMNRLAALSTETGILSYTKGIQMPDGPQFDRALAEAERFLTPAQMEVFALLVDYRQISFTLTKIANERRK